MDKDFFEKGLKKRQETLGKEYVENNLTNADDFTLPFQEAMTAWCWGFGWGDETIDPKTRSMMNLSICLLYKSPSPRDATLSRMPSSA